jgi:hypothetical protein
VIFTSLLPFRGISTKVKRIWTIVCIKRQISLRTNAWIIAVKTLHIADKLEMQVRRPATIFV